MILLLSGLVSQVLYKDYLNFFNHSLINIPVLLFFTGVTTALLAMLGLVGACLNNRVLLTTSISVMVFTLTLEMVGSLGFYHYQDTVSLFVHYQLLSGLGIFNNPDYRGVTETWNVAQHEAGSVMRNIFLMRNIYFPAGLLWSQVVQGLGGDRPQPHQHHPPRSTGPLRARLLLQS